MFDMDILIEVDVLVLPAEKVFNSLCKAVVVGFPLFLFLLLVRGLKHLVLGSLLEIHLNGHEVPILDEMPGHVHHWFADDLYWCNTISYVEQYHAMAS
jgi:hypothetical protein